MTAALIALVAGLAAAAATHDYRHRRGLAWMIGRHFTKGGKP